MDLEHIRAYRKSKNAFCIRMGIQVEELRPGYARVVKTLTAEDENPVGLPHGGVYFSMADTACGSAMAAYGVVCVTINSSFSFLKSARTGDRLTAEARELQSGRSVAVLEARVTSEAGDLLAVGTFTFRRTSRSLENFM